MNIYRIFPGLDAFQIVDAFLPWLDVIAENENKALQAGKKVIADLDEPDSLNQVNVIEFIQKFS